MADRYVSNDPNEVVVKRDGTATALVVLTTLALLGAIVCVEKAKQKHYDTGMFGKTKGAPNVPVLTDRAVEELRNEVPPTAPK